MRRFILPALVLSVAIIASVLAANANDAANPDDPSTTDTGPSLATPLLSVRRTPEWLRQPTTTNLLDTAVRRPVDAVGDTGLVCLSVHVNGQSVTEVASDLPFNPGESQRLLTLAALDTVGTGAFTTEVVRATDGVIDDDGVLQGDLWLIGGADPVLSTNAFISRFDDSRAFTSLEELALNTATALGEAGITAVAGRIIGVDSKYEGSPQVFDFEEPTWTRAEVDSKVVGVTSGLLVNNGFSSYPDDTVDPTANVRTTDAVTHAASEFAVLLNFFGIPATGGVAGGDAPPAVDREPVASIDSPPLSEIARRALVDGTTAEMLWREIAVRGGGSASNFDVVLGINAALIELGLLQSEEAGNFGKFDGSGLSLRNRTRCDVLAGVLDLDPDGLAVQALRDVGESTVAECAPSSFDSLHVTASARPEVTSMAGKAVASNGDVLTFSVIANWVAGESGLADRGVCDGLLPGILDAIAEHPAGPELDDLTPLTPALPADADE